MAEKSRFDTESTARHYAAARPTYPSELFDALDDLLGYRLAGASVVDVAAGTGISSRQLAERGANVTAVKSLFFAGRSAIAIFVVRSTSCMRAGSRSFGA